VLVLCFFCYFLLVIVILVVSTSEIDCPERLVPEMTHYVSSGTLNSTYSHISEFVYNNKHHKAFKVSSKMWLKLNL